TGRGSAKHGELCGDRPAPRRAPPPRRGAATVPLLRPRQPAGHPAPRRALADPVARALAGSADPASAAPARRPLGFESGAGPRVRPRRPRPPAPPSPAIPALGPRRCRLGPAIHPRPPVRHDMATATASPLLDRLRALLGPGGVITAPSELV